MTRRATYILTAVSAALFALLTWAFADGQFTTGWDHEDWFKSAFFTYGFIAVIVLAGLYQARHISNDPVDLTSRRDDTTPGQLTDPRLARLLLGNRYLAIFWLPIRFFVGREWLSAGVEKLRSDAWMSGGTALKGYWTNAVAIPEKGRPPITYGWFRDFLEYMLRHEWYTWFAKLIAFGETLVGLGIILGALVGIAAFFGTLLNFNFMLAGSASSNPVLFGLTVFIILAWKVAGFWGLDRVLLPELGAPWKPGQVFHHGAARANGVPA